MFYPSVSLTIEEFLDIFIPAFFCVKLFKINLRRTVSMKYTGGVGSDPTRGSG